MRMFSLILLLSAAVIPGSAQDKPATTDDSSKARVFITDSQSWEMTGSSGGSGGAFGGSAQGGARPQTAEIIKTFGERCTGVMVNNIQGKSDYVVVLDHEGGKGFLRHRNKVAVFARVSGDSIVSKSTFSLGASVQEACAAISKDWAEHGSDMRAAAAAQRVRPPLLSPRLPPFGRLSSTARLSVVSVPDGGDIEVDGSFVGNTPSDIQVGEGDHTVTVKKAGFQSWERKLKVTAGSRVHLNAELEKTANP